MAVTGTVLAGLFVLFRAVLYAEATGPHFRGGALDWRVESFDKVQKTYNVSFTYRLTWDIGEGPCGQHCSVASIGHSMPAVGPESFICEKGCTGQTKLSDTAYTVSAISQFDHWEHGTGSFNTIFHGDGPFTVSFQGHDWTPVHVETSGNWRLETEVNLGLRSDTALPNSSPVTFNTPLYKIFTGCLMPIKLMAMDPDGDKIKCRWAMTQDECGGICSGFPGAKLDPDTCTITPVTTLSFGTGIFAVSVVVEDYPYSDVYVNGQVYNPKKPFSQTPTQFLVYASRHNLQCNPPQFINSPWINAQVDVIKPDILYTAKLCARPSTGNLITDFDVSSPVGMTHISAKGIEKGSLCVNLRWIPTKQQIGSHMVCVAPEQSDGTTSVPECITLYVDAVDRCNTNPCSTGMSCVNVIHGYYCVNRTAPSQATNSTELSSATCLLNVLDLVFVLDASNSLTDTDKTEMKAFITRLVNSFGVDVNKTHVGLMTFDNDPHVMFNLDTHTTKTDVLKAIDNIQFGFGGTDTGKALKFLKEEMFTTAHGDRPHVPNVAVVLTDGQSKDSYATQYYAQQSRQLGITIFGVGIGPRVDPGELKNMSNYPADKYSFIIHSFADLLQVGDKLVNTTCSVRLPSVTIPTQTTERPGCYNRNNNCLMYGSDVCTDYPGWSSYHCRLWCGFCNGTTTLPPCVDIKHNCEEYGHDICTRPDLRIWAQSYCRAYCGFPPCTGTPTKTTTTPKPTTPFICRDRIDNCAVYGTNVCHDPEYVGWAKGNCPAFCGYCTEYKDIPAVTIGNLQCPPWKLPVECEMDYLHPTCCPMPTCPPGFTLTVQKPHL